MPLPSFVLLPASSFALVSFFHRGEDEQHLSIHGTRTRRRIEYSRAMRWCGAVTTSPRTWYKVCKVYHRRLALPQSGNNYYCLRQRALARQETLVLHCTAHCTIVVHCRLPSRTTAVPMGSSAKVSSRLAPGQPGEKGGGVGLRCVEQFFPSGFPHIHSNRQQAQT